MVLAPAKRLAVHLDDLLVADQDAEHLADDLGNQTTISPAKMDPRERDNLNKLVGVLIQLNLDQNPGKYAKGAEGRLNVEKLATEIQATMDEMNERVARVEQVKKFVILPRELTIADGELTGTLKVKRNIAMERFADVIDGMYTEA